MRRTRWRLRQLRWLLRRWPLQLITGIIMALTTGAIVAAAAIGLALVEPHARVYPVSLLSLLAANYAPWPEAAPLGGPLDPAIVAEAAHDEAMRSVTPEPSDGGLIPMDLPPLPQAVAPDGVAGQRETPGTTVTSVMVLAQTPPPTYTPTPSTSSSPTIDSRPSATAHSITPASPASASPTSQRPTPKLLASPTARTAPAPTAALPSATVRPATRTPSPTSMVTSTGPTSTSTAPAILSTATLVPSQTPKPTATVVPPTATGSALTAVPTATPSRTPTQTLSATAVSTATPSRTPTQTPSATAIPTATPSHTPTQTPSATAVPTATPPPTNIPTNTPTPTSTLIPSPTDTPTQTPSATPTATPTVTDTPTSTAVPPTDTPTPTVTPVPVGLVVQIIVPNDGAIVSSPAETNFRALAYDPAVGTNDGDGITSVDFSIVLISGSGNYGHNRSDTVAPYCAYGGNNVCPTIPNWAQIDPGTYRLSATANAPGKPSVTVSVTFTKP